MRRVLGGEAQREDTSAGAVGVRKQQRHPGAGGAPDLSVEGGVGIRELLVGWDAGSRWESRVQKHRQGGRAEGGGDLGVLLSGCEVGEDDRAVP